MKPAHMPDGWPPWKFIFATGIECSYPVITGKDGRDQRIRRARENVSLQILEGRLDVGPRDGAAVLALWAAVLQDSPCPREVRLGVHGPCIRGDAAAQNNSHRGPVSLWRAGLGGRFPEPGLARVVQPVCERFCRAFFLGTVLHAGKRNLRLREALRLERNLERA